MALLLCAYLATAQRKAIESGLFTMERDTDAATRLKKVLLGQLQVAFIGHGIPGLEHIVNGHPHLMDHRDALSVLPTLVFSQAVMLYISPVIYLALDRFSGKGPVLTLENPARYKYSSCSRTSHARYSPIGLEF